MVDCYLGSSVPGGGSWPGRGLDVMLSRGTVIDVLHVAHGRLFLREYACIAHIVCVVELRALLYNKCAGNLLLFVVLNPHLPNASCTRD